MLIKYVHVTAAFISETHSASLQLRTLATSLLTAGYLASPSGYGYSNLRSYCSHDMGSPWSDSVDFQRNSVSELRAKHLLSANSFALFVILSTVPWYSSCKRRQ